MASYPPINSLPAPLAGQYPPIHPVHTIHLSNSTYETGAMAPPVNLSSSSTSVAPNTGITQTMFGGGRRTRRRRRSNARQMRSRKARRRRHSRSRRYHS